VAKRAMSIAPSASPRCSNRCNWAASVSRWNVMVKSCRADNSINICWPMVTNWKLSSRLAGANQRLCGYLLTAWSNGQARLTTETYMNNDTLLIAGKSYNSRLLVGTGKYKDFAKTKAAVEASGAEIITIAIRRSNIGQNPNEPSLLEILPPSQYTLPPNTAGFC